jgi:hypothetical protein
MIFIGGLKVMIINKEKIKSIILAVFTILIIGLIIIIIFGSNLSCFMTAPVRENYNSDECFQAADCNYRNKDNPDKSACSDARKDCTYANKENRIKARIKFCNKPSKRGDLTPKECRYELNQK